MSDLAETPPPLGSQTDFLKNILLHIWGLQPVFGETIITVDNSSTEFINSKVKNEIICFQGLTNEVITIIAFFFQ